MAGSASAVGMAVNGSHAATSAQNPEAAKVASYPWFDWLRFALASIVVLDHSGLKILPFLSGGLAVKVFFALSGWLIGGILLRTELKELPRFFFNRSTRIWIPYAFAILLLYSVAIAKEGIDFFWVKYLILDVTFTHQLYTFFPAASFELPLDGSGNQFWSIAVEEQFYLLAPLVMLLFPRGKTILLWAPLTALLLFLGLHMGTIALGVCAAILQRDHRIVERRFVRIGAILLALACSAYMWIDEGQYLAGPLFAVSVVVALAVRGRRSEIALAAGGLSYPLYLNQWIGAFAVHFVTQRWLPMNHQLEIAAVYAFSVMMALAMYWSIDRQIQLHRNSWYTPALGRKLGIIAYALVSIGIVVGGAMHVYGPHGVPPASAGEMNPAYRGMER